MSVITQSGALTAERIPLIDICPRCGNRMTQTIQEHVMIRTCLQDGYEARDIDGESKLAYDLAVGTFRVTRAVR